METPNDAEKQTPAATSSATSVLDPEESSPGYNAPEIVKWLVVVATGFAALTAAWMVLKGEVSPPELPSLPLFDTQMVLVGTALSKDTTSAASAEMAMGL